MYMYIIRTLISKITNWRFLLVKLPYKNSKHWNETNNASIESSKLYTVKRGTEAHKKGNVVVLINDTWCTYVVKGWHTTNSFTIIVITFLFYSKHNTTFSEVFAFTLLYFIRFAYYDESYTKVIVNWLLLCTVIIVVCEFPLHLYVII